VRRQKQKQRRRTLSADKPDGSRNHGQEYTMENKRAGNVSSVPRATRKRQPPHLKPKGAAPRHTFSLTVDCL